MFFITKWAKMTKKPSGTSLPRKWDVTCEHYGVCFARAGVPRGRFRPLGGGQGAQPPGNFLNFGLAKVNIFNWNLLGCKLRVNRGKGV